MKLSDINPSKNQRVLLIGHSGSGKTNAAMSYPGPILNFDFDGRIRSVLPFYPQNLERDEVETYGPYEFQRLWDRLQKLRAGDVRHKTYVLDSFTALAKMAINFSQENRGEGIGKVIGKSSKIPIMDLPDFNAEANLLGHVLALFRSLNANFIMTAHHMETSSKKKGSSKDMVGEDIVVHKLVTAAKLTAAEAPIYFDETYYIYKVDKVQPPNAYKASTMDMNGITICKTALPLPAEIDFTMEKGGEGLYQKIQRICKEKGIEL